MVDITARMERTGDYQVEGLKLEVNGFDPDRSRSRHWLTLCICVSYLTPCIYLLEYLSGKLFSVKVDKNLQLN